MNSIHTHISELINELTELYRKNSGTNWSSVYILNDVYDLVITLWNTNVIDDSSLAMRY